MQRYVTQNRFSQLVVILLVGFFFLPTCTLAAPLSVEEFIALGQETRSEVKNLTSLELWALYEKSFYERQISEQSVPKDHPLRGMFEPVNARMATYQLVFRDRADGGDPVATYAYAVLNLETCHALVKGLGSEGAGVGRCYRESISRLESIADENYHAAFELGVMHAKGQGVASSKYNAADWFTKSGNAALDSMDREYAVRAMEAALEQVADHPEALRLKNIMFN
ncbi:hypothetical protein N9V40_00880 [Pseudomonadales bacterium]|nr:hypothetical protein [Pseudomonadales bacterium]